MKYLKKFEDEDYLIKNSDLDDLAQSEDEDFLSDVGDEWIASRAKARALYNNDGSPDFIKKVIEYITDDKNAPIFKTKLLKHLIGKSDKN
jgi:ribosome biogenesis protein Nip4